MKKLKSSMLVKMIAVILFCALCFGCTASALATGMLYSAGYYDKGKSAARERLAQSLCMLEGGNHAWFYAGSGTDNAALNLLGENYRYEVYDVNGELRLSNYHGEAALASATIPCSFWYSYAEAPYGSLWGEEAEAQQNEESSPAGEPQAVQTAAPLPDPTSPSVTPTPRPVTPGDIYGPKGRTVSCTVVCYLLHEMTEKDAAWFQLHSFDFAAANSGLILAAAALCLLFVIALFVFLMCAAGHQKDTDEIKESWIEKIPFDLFTVMVAAAGSGILYLFTEILDHLTRDIPFRLGAAAVLFLAGTLLFLLWCMSLAVRIKLKSLIEGTICCKLLSFLWRVVKSLLGWMRMLLRSIPLVWRGALGYLAFAFVGQLLMIAFHRSAEYLWFFGSLFLFPAVVWLLVCVRRLRVGAKEIADGNTHHTIPTKYLFGEFLRHAEDLNSIQNGISRAVEERMRSERMKTELITNVSHDIKTPLTSIINYVDLLSRETIDNEQARAYIEVLQRQSGRLKKLTDDLVEASKASSGALAVTLEDCDLGVMLEQATGEYGEKLAEQSLELILRKPEKEVLVRADARHTRRIFDNLISNVLKYALPGTRVYLELQDSINDPSVIFRNISRFEIVQSPEELTERFVRGDASRSSEGSGLGLSIARSLAELQGGGLSVMVDGDLFKVTLCFSKKV